MKAWLLRETYSNVIHPVQFSHGDPSNEYTPLFIVLSMQRLVHLPITVAAEDIDVRQSLFSSKRLHTKEDVLALWDSLRGYR